VGRQALGAKWLRRIARATGLEIVHASGNGGYVHEFTTADHEHGRFDIKTGEWWMYDPCPLFSSCLRLFGGDS
jgi:hypothetical protein